MIVNYPQIFFGSGELVYFTQNDGRDNDPKI